MYINCLICSKQFRIYPSRLNRIKYCSRGCRLIYKKSRTGNKSSNWKQGKRLHKNNTGRIYKMVCISDGKYAYEHRLIMEQHLGRKLRKNEVIHHLNHDSLDNRIKNLQLITRGKHNQVHPRIKTKPAVS